MQNLNKLAFGDITRQNLLVCCLILGIFLLGSLGVWFNLQKNLNKLALGDMTRENFQVRAHYSSDGYVSPGKLGSGSLYVYICTVRKRRLCQLPQKGHVHCSV
jgi:hypothetical protein